MSRFSSWFYTQSFGVQAIIAVVVVFSFAAVMALSVSRLIPKYQYTLTCSGNVIVKDVRHLYLQHRSGTYSFNSGSYTPKQGEVCIVTRLEIK